MHAIDKNIFYLLSMLIKNYHNNYGDLKLILRNTCLLSYNIHQKQIRYYIHSTSTRVFNNFSSFSVTQDYATELKMFELINFKKIFFIVYISITSQNKIQKEAL